MKESNTQKELSRVPRTLSESSNTKVLEVLFDAGGTVMSDIIIYVASSQMKDLFGDCWFSINDFCEVMGYERTKLQRKLTEKQLDFLFSNQRPVYITEQNGQKIEHPIENTFEAALYRLGTSNLSVAYAMNGKTQYGLVVGAYVPDYMNGVIKKHELTRRDKEEDRMKHVRVNNANIEPVFFAYPDNEKLDVIIKKYTANKPVYDFIAPGDGFGHTFWIVDQDADIATITAEFAKMPALYIADGHHRSAAAALVGAEKAKQNPNHRGDEEYNYFMAVCFPANQLTIIDYNRVVKDLNGLTPEQFLAALDKNFIVEEKGADIYKPSGLHNFSLYLGGKWYSLTAKAGTYNDNDPIGVLDVTISSNLILDEVLGIKDLRSDKRIDFVGGIRGLGELKKRVDSGEMKVALALYPVSMKQLMDIADTGNIMPPKTTWFEPKLRSGLVIHKLD